MLAKVIVLADVISAFAMLFNEVKLAGPDAAASVYVRVIVTLKFIPVSQSRSPGR